MGYCSGECYQVVIDSYDYSQVVCDNCKTEAEALIVAAAYKTIHPNSSPRVRKDTTHEM